ncbi:MAG: hypothetical protein JW896_17135 [Deltaproteobacteria bacterium]|nr:hypothetical protein [Deltaproteobacteria bacterium]
MPSNHGQIVSDQPLLKVYFGANKTWLTSSKIEVDMGMSPKSYLIRMTGMPQEVKESCRKLIELCDPGGGHVLSGGASIDKRDPYNLLDTMEVIKEYSVC